MYVTSRMPLELAILFIIPKKKNSAWNENRVIFRVFPVWVCFVLFVAPEQ